METNPVGPALTRDEFGRIAVVHGRNGGAFVEAHNPDELAVGMEPGRRVAYFSGEDRRALGALALLGYFTHADVELLRDAVADWRPGYPDSLAACRLVDRLAALLPSETP